MFGRSKKTKGEKAAGSDSDRPRSMETDRTLTEGPTQAQVKRATRTRLCWSLFASFLLLLTIIFMILVETGQTDKSQSEFNKTYFLKLDLANIIPTSVPNSSIINSIAQTIGLHDFYTVGLWGFCEGYTNGVTNCSKPKALFWFNPVQIILNELLSGATIVLPTELTNDLGLLETASKWMFGLFLSGACLDFVMIFLQPVSVFSRWWALLVMIFTFLGALLTTVGAVIATVLFIILQNVATSVAEINIGASLGSRMFAFMWIAAACSIIAWLIQLCLCCCCASRRDVKNGRKRGSKKAWNTETTGVTEKPPRKGIFGRKK
ncbi:SUR7/PalI family-domain-containing protein [Delphinella strobiligena]|nr:SUR7/PalI family-domain-containing protein [Delphinella strobiligena]